MDIERWELGIARQLDPAAKTDVLLEKKGKEGLLRFVVPTLNGEIFVAIDQEGLVRISRAGKRADHTYCVFEISLAKFSDFLNSGKYELGDLGDAVYEDPVVSGLTRGQAIELLGIHGEAER